MGLNDLRAFLSAPQVMMVAAAGLLLGVGSCFFGYRLFRFMLALGGFVLGAALGFVVSQGTLPAIPSIIVSLLFGLAVAYVSYFAYKVGVFLHVGAGVLILGSLFSNDNGAVILVALVLATCAVLLVRPVIIVYTGIAGGLLAGGASGLLQGSAHWSRVGLPSIILACAGILFQFWHTSNSKPR